MTNQTLLQSLYIGRIIYLANNQCLTLVEIKKLFIKEDCIYINASEGYCDGYLTNSLFTLIRRGTEEKIRYFLSEKEATKYHSQERIKLIKSHIERKHKEICEHWEEIGNLNKFL